MAHHCVKTGLKMLNRLQYAVLFRPLLPCAASIDQNLEQILRTSLKKMSENKIRSEEKSFIARCHRILLDNERNK
jgi:hypothetical protein